MRLIDADALIETLTKYKFGAISNDTERDYVKETVLSFVKEQPTAFNVDKVVEVLEELKSLYSKLKYEHNDANMISAYVGKGQAIDCAIDIVRKGGV